MTNLAMIALCVRGPATMVLGSPGASPLSSALSVRPLPVAVQHNCQLGLGDRGPSLELSLLPHVARLFKI